MHGRPRRQRVPSLAAAGWWQPGTAQRRSAPCGRPHASTATGRRTAEGVVAHVQAVEGKGHRAPLLGQRPRHQVVADVHEAQHRHAGGAASAPGAGQAAAQQVEGQVERGQRLEAISQAPPCTDSVHAWTRHTGRQWQRRDLCSRWRAIPWRVSSAGSSWVQLRAGRAPLTFGYGPCERIPAEVQGGRIVQIAAPHCGQGARQAVVAQGQGLQLQEAACTSPVCTARRSSAAGSRWRCPVPEQRS